MTLPPLDSFEVARIDGPRYKVGPHCCNPTCGRMAEHQHHLFRRSRHGKADWMQLPDGTIRGNIVALCYPCHVDVTGEVGGHKAAIRFHGDTFYWALPIPGHRMTYELVAPIEPQPPTLGDEVVELAEPESCPTCGRGKKKAQKREPARKRKSWTVQVPADEEDGAQVMDDYVEALCDIFELEAGGGALTRYHALTRAAAFTLVNRDQVPDDAKARRS